MATVSRPDSAEKTADLLQNLSLESAQTKTLEIPEPTKKTSVYQYRMADSGITADSQIHSAERSMTPFLPDLMDPNICYLHNGYPSPAYYYGSYNGVDNTWEDYTRYGNLDGVEMTQGVYGDGGSLMYHSGYGYPSFGPYSPAATPVPALGNDGQLYGHQQYHYPTYFQPQVTTGGPFTPNQTAGSQGALSSSTVTNQKPVPAETNKGNSNSFAVNGVMGNGYSTPYKPIYQNSSDRVNNTYGRGSLPGGFLASGYQDTRFGFDGNCRSNGITSFSKAKNNPSSKNHNFRQNSNFMGLHHPGPPSGMGTPHGFINRMYPNKFYGPYGNTYRSSVAFGSGGYDSRINGYGWLAVDGKYKVGGRGNDYSGYHNDSVDGLNELNRGPRAKGFKNQKGFAQDQTFPSSESVVEDKDEASNTPDREQYNKTDFPENYADAKFFIIKSYSEDDVHKSIKYNVWASTPNGNKKLDAAYQEAQQKSDGCPMFLLFSVNTSGQFVGLAEMVGSVDFQTNVEYWQQDKWTGCFPVKWHIVKDIPNSLLKHITLENNENKPVTNSRDTQEVKLEQGLKMIKIFKEHSSKACILDDFGFYEQRQRIIQEKKVKQQQFQKQVSEEKPVEEKKGLANGTTKSPEVNEDAMHLEKGTVAGMEDALKKTEAT